MFSVKEMLRLDHTLQLPEKRLQPGEDWSLFPGNQDWSFSALNKILSWTTSLNEKVILCLSRVTAVTSVEGGSPKILRSSLYL